MKPILQYLLICLLLINSLISQTLAQFKEVKTDLENVNNSSVAWGDYDNDDDLDIFLMGWNGKERVSKIYQNNQGIFKDIQADITPVNSIVCNNMAWGDYDNDGYLDILMTGQDGKDRITQIYHNNSDGTFTEVPTIMQGVFAASVAWADYDNDGDLDILLTGRNPDHLELAIIYRNDKGRFIETNMGFEGVENSSAAFGDYDNDGDWDILLTGRDNSPKLHVVTKIYQNDKGQYKEIQANLEAVHRSSVAWADYDNDDDMDILLTGLNNSMKNVTKIYRNDAGNFVEVPTSIPAISRSSVAWGDYDSDGDLDILISGVVEKNTRITRVYENHGNNKFIDIQANLANISSGSVAWGDYDNDGDLDILITGEDENYKVFTKLYDNTLNKELKKPQIPGNLQTEIIGKQVQFSWDKPFQPGLTFNLRIGSEKGADDVFSGMSDPRTGYMRVAELGNTAHHTQWIINDLPPGTYYWSVQSVNNAFVGSSFAGEQEFTIK